MKKTIAAITVASAVFSFTSQTFAAETGDQHKDPWGYSGPKGPENWGDMEEAFLLCKAGTMQSPINIDHSIDADLSDMEFMYKPGPFQVLHNGHTILVNYDFGSRVKIDGEPYELLQFHFHTPSEHTIGGRSAPMEVHLVHRNTHDQLAVIGIFIKEGKHNKVLEPVWNNMPEKVGGSNVVRDADINAFDLLPVNVSRYHYMGSLTTPPCSEGVRWYVMETPIEMSKEQIDKFVSAVGDSARPAQELSERFILFSE